MTARGNGTPRLAQAPVGVSRNLTFRPFSLLKYPTGSSIGFAIGSRTDGRRGVNPPASGPITPLTRYAVATAAREGRGTRPEQAARPVQINPSLANSAFMSVSGRAPKWLITSAAATQPIRPATDSGLPVARP